MTENVALMVTTEKKGVFFGYGNPENKINTTVTITNARMCVYWHSDVKGVLGLAATGPTKNCKITAAVPEITLQGVTSVSLVSEVATKAWEVAPWA
jgi:hypothetical protein